MQNCLRYKNLFKCISRIYRRSVRIQPEHIIDSNQDITNQDITNQDITNQVELINNITEIISQDTTNSSNNASSNCPSNFMME